jgi:integrase/recombinase XerD
MSVGFVSLQALVQRFFEQHLTVERCASSNTVLAYRDALKLFLAHASSCLGCSPDRLDHSVLDVALVRSFLDGLSKERACGPRTRNQRLAAIKTFARYVASVAPEHLDRCRQIRELLPARFDHPEVSYLEDDEILSLVRAPIPIRRVAIVPCFCCSTTRAHGSRRSSISTSATFTSIRSLMS